MSLKRDQRALSAAPRAPRAVFILAAMLAVLTLSAIWPGLSTVAGQESEDWSIERFRQETSLEGDRRVVVSGLSGDVRIRPGESGKLELSAVAQRHPEDAFTPSVVLRRTPEALFVDPVFLDEEERPVVDPPAEPRRRIDVVIYLPATTAVEVRGDRDTVEVKGMESAVNADTSRGDIVISTTGAVAATTERGEIRVTFSRLTWEGGSNLESLTGDISVVLPAEPNLIVRGETFGELSTDFSIEVERRPPSVKKHFVASIGNPGRELLVTSNRGRVRLLRSPV